MGLSTQHCINCMGMQSGLVFRISKFCCSEGGRPETGHLCCRNGRFGKKGLHWSCSHIVVTIVSPSLTPSSAPAPVPVAANLDSVDKTLAISQASQSAALDNGLHSLCLKVVLLLSQRSVASYIFTGSLGMVSDPKERAKLA